MEVARLLLLLSLVLIASSGIVADSACSLALEGKIRDSAQLSSIVANARSQYVVVFIG